MDSFVRCDNIIVQWTRWFTRHVFYIPVVSPIGRVNFRGFRPNLGQMKEIIFPCHTLPQIFADKCMWPKIKVRNEVSRWRSAIQCSATVSCFQHALCAICVVPFDFWTGFDGCQRAKEWTACGSQVSGTVREMPVWLSACFASSFRWQDNVRDSGAVLAQKIFSGWHEHFHQGQGKARKALQQQNTRQHSECPTAPSGRPQVLCERTGLWGKFEWNSHLQHPQKRPWSAQKSSQTCANFLEWHPKRSESSTVRREFDQVEERSGSFSEQNHHVRRNLAVHLWARDQKAKLSVVEQGGPSPTASQACKQRPQDNDDCLLRQAGCHPCRIFGAQRNCQFWALHRHTCQNEGGSAQETPKVVGNWQHWTSPLHPANGQCQSPHCSSNSSQIGTVESASPCPSPKFARSCTLWFCFVSKAEGIFERDPVQEHWRTPESCHTGAPPDAQTVFLSGYLRPDNPLEEMPACTGRVFWGGIHSGGHWDHPSWGIFRLRGRLNFGSLKSAFADLVNQVNVCMCFTECSTFFGMFFYDSLALLACWLAALKVWSKSVVNFFLYRRNNGNIKNMPRNQADLEHFGFSNDYCPERTVNRLSSLGGCVNRTKMFRRRTNIPMTSATLFLDVQNGLRQLFSL